VPSPPVPRSHAERAHPETRTHARDPPNRPQMRAQRTGPALSVAHLSKRFGDRIAFAAALLVLTRLGWRIASAIFDRERLITGTK
jgi:hypothetical protein